MISGSASPDNRVVQQKALLAPVDDFHPSVFLLVSKVFYLHRTFHPPFLIGGIFLADRRLTREKECCFLAVRLIEQSMVLIFSLICTNIFVV